MTPAPNHRISVVSRVVSPPVVVLYAGGVLLGMVLITVPALSAAITQQFKLSDAAYGSVFLPQLALAIVGALGGGTLARRLGLKTLLLLALACYAIAQGLLAASASLPAEAAFPAILVSTAFVGFGAGMHGAPINTWPGILFPRHAHAAVVAVHMLIGLGFAAGPLLATSFIDAGMWSTWPVVLSAVAVAVLIASALVTLPPEPPHPDLADGEVTDARERHPVFSVTFWLFAGNALLYAFTEGIFSNWSVLFLTEARGVGAAPAGVALSAFWGAIVLGRLGGSVLVGRMSPRLVWAGLPVLMAIAFLLVPAASGPVSGILIFAFAGLACSAQFPLTISLASETFPRHVPFVTSMMIAAVMLGIGAGSFLLGALRTWLSFDALYRLSILFPLLMLALSIPILRRRGSG